MIDWGLIRASLPDLASGLATTFWLWAAGSVLGVVLGLAVALLRRFGGRALRAALGVPVWVILGTPFLVQLFLVYYGGPYVGVALDPAPAGLIGLSVYGAAYFSEIFRAGFEAIPLGHVEAAICVGLTRAQIVRRIMLPEMTLLVLPAATNMVVVLLKETAVLSIVTVPELTMTITAIGSANFAFAEATLLLALSYWGLTELAGWAGHGLERSLSRLRFAV
jgi:polar amino acid transport system permease protein